jgi:hypothetical protein
VKEILLSQLNCSFGILKFLNLIDLPICATPDIAKNVINLVEIAFEKSLQNCMRPCTTYLYDLKVTFSHWNSIDIYEPNEAKDKSLFMIYYYYESVDTEIDSEYLLRDGNASLADIGGYLGLFLGISCFSVFSLFINFLQAKFS